MKVFGRTPLVLEAFPKDVHPDWKNFNPQRALALFRLILTKGNVRD